MVLVVAGCGGLTPLGSDYDEDFDVVVAYCYERIHLNDTCDPTESTAGDEIWSYVFWGAPTAGHTVRVVREVVKGGGERHETDQAIVPIGKRAMDGVQLTRAFCDDGGCKIVTRAYVDGDEVAKAGFSFDP